MEPEPAFIHILKTQSLTDIASIKSVLDAEGVNYFLQGENMSHIVPYVDPAVLMVVETDVEKTIELLRPLKLNCVWMIFP